MSRIAARTVSSSVGGRPSILNSTSRVPGNVRVPELQKLRDARLVESGTGGYVDFQSFGLSADPVNGNPDQWPPFTEWVAWANKAHQKP